MAKKFTVDVHKKQQKVQASYFSREVRAAKEKEIEDPRLQQAADLQDRVEDDFDYTIAGIERLGREGNLDEAIKLLNTLADTLDSAIGIIGGDFENNKSIDSYTGTDFEDLEGI
jgi:hypothetical protein